MRTILTVFLGCILSGGCGAVDDTPLLRTKSADTEATHPKLAAKDAQAGEAPATATTPADNTNAPSTIKADRAAVSDDPGLVAPHRDTARPRN